MRIFLGNIKFEKTWTGSIGTDNCIRRKCRVRMLFDDKSYAFGQQMQLLCAITDKDNHLLSSNIPPKIPGAHKDAIKKSSKHP